MPFSYRIQISKPVVAAFFVILLLPLLIFFVAVDGKFYQQFIIMILMMGGFVWSLLDQSSKRRIIVSESGLEFQGFPAASGMHSLRWSELLSLERATCSVLGLSSSLLRFTLRDGKGFVFDVTETQSQWRTPFLPEVPGAPPLAQAIISAWGGVVGDAGKIAYPLEANTKRDIGPQANRIAILSFLLVVPSLWLFTQAQAHLLDVPGLATLLISVAVVVAIPAVIYQRRTRLIVIPVTTSVLSAVVVLCVWGLLPAQAAWLAAPQKVTFVMVDEKGYDQAWHSVNHKPELRLAQYYGHRDAGSIVVLDVSTGWFGISSIPEAEYRALLPPPPSMDIPKHEESSQPRMVSGKSRS